MSSSLITNLESLVDALGRLCTALSDEHEALRTQRYEALRDATSTKDLAVQEVRELSARLGNEPLCDQIAAAGEADRPTLDALHKSIKLLAISAQNQNLVNGKIIHRSQQSARELLALMYGRDTDALYGQTGQPTATATGGAIAEA